MLSGKSSDRNRVPPCNASKIKITRQSALRLGADVPVPTVSVSVLPEWSGSQRPPRVDDFSQRTHASERPDSYQESLQSHGRRYQSTATGGTRRGATANWIVTDSAPLHTGL